MWWWSGSSFGRNMRTSYNNAKGWEGSTGAGSMDGETIKATLLKKCSFCFELDDIFGSRLTENAIIEETLETLLTPDTLECTEEAEIEESSSSNHLIVTENVTSINRRGIYSRTALSDIMQIQSEMLSFRKEKDEKEFNLKEKEFALKEREVELREEEIKSNERMKIMDLEMGERLAMKELQLKYK